ncbi:MAG: hypothetical protein QG673_628 [Pseudomonadota bacterium]|nr:hypothetical protein [Pseudomonadota bacterium]
MEAVSNLNNLYKKDFYAWIKEQARLLKTNEFNQLDIANLVEEVESMGSSEVRELESRFEILLMHLLKWKYQPNSRSVSWELTIKEQRKRIAVRIKKMPSLKTLLNETMLEAYDIAIYEAAKETKLSLKAFPDLCEWDLKQVLDDQFYPS